MNTLTHQFIWTEKKKKKKIRKRKLAMEEKINKTEQL